MYTKEFREYLSVLALVCQKLTFTHLYGIDISFEENANEHEPEGYKIPLCIDTDTVYENVMIYVYPEFFKQYQDKHYAKMGQEMLHEFCHVIHQPMKDLAWEHAPPAILKQVKDTNETAVQRTSRVIETLLPANWAHPNKVKKLL